MGPRAEGLKSDLRVSGSNHGDYDPHPSEGVRKPLSAVLSEFRFVLLENCGHTPWCERQARGAFYEVLEEELQQGFGPM